MFILQFSFIWLTEVALTIKFYVVSSEDTGFTLVLFFGILIFCPFFEFNLFFSLSAEIQQCQRLLF